MKAAAIEVVEALRCDEGRYWAYTCQSAACCPVAGHPYSVSDSRFAAAAVAAGMVALPSRAALLDLIAPVDGPAREEMVVATTRAEAQAAALLAEIEDDRYWIDEALFHLDRCLQHLCEGQAIPTEALATLGVLITSITIRDLTFAISFSRYSHKRARQLWVEMTRRLDPDYVPAAAGNLALYACHRGEGVLARAAAERALALTPTYSLAHLVMAALDTDVPIEKLARIDFAEIAQLVREDLDAHPASARPILAAR
ncbi:DUF4192 domain-containing protein [Nonomuraea recticatena]|uniref:Uncharacterized protein n=1 Tax=Nonomuraea recticatena TaxID=46178 RepID=A0ABN3S7U1_9ACTN